MNLYKKKLQHLNNELNGIHITYFNAKRIASFTLQVRNYELSLNSTNKAPVVTDSYVSYVLMSKQMPIKLLLL